MRGLFTSIVLVTFLIVGGHGLPVAEPSTETVLFYNSKSETVAPLVDKVDVNSVAIDSVAASVSSVGLDEVSSSVNQDEKSVDSTVSPAIAGIVTEKKVKKGKADDGQAQTVKKVEPVVAEVPVTEVGSSSALKSDSVQTEAPSQYSAGVAEDSVRNASPEVAPVAVVPAKAEPVNAEVKNESTSNNISAYLAEPINQATKLLVDLEEQIKGYLNTDLGDDSASTLSPQSYGAGPNEPEIEPSSTDARQNEQLAGMVDQIEMTIHNLDQSIEDLMANRRYMTAAMMRSMRSYLRGVQNNLQRLQNRLRALQAVASSANAPPTEEGSAPGAFPSNAFFESLRVRINRITSDITNLMNRMRSTLVSSTTARPSNG